MLLIMIHIYLKYILIYINIHIYIYIEYFVIYISYKSASIHSVYLRSNILAQCPCLQQCHYAHYIAAGACLKHSANLIQVF